MGDRGIIFLDIPNFDEIFMTKRSNRSKKSQFKRFFIFGGRMKNVRKSKFQKVTEKIQNVGSFSSHEFPVKRTSLICLAVTLRLVEFQSPPDIHA